MRWLQSPALLVLLVACGCGASGTPFRDVEFDRTTGGIVYWYRPSHFTASMTVASVRAAGHTLGELKNGGCLWATLPPGTHRMTVRGVSGSTGFVDGDVTVEKGAVVYIRVLPVPITQSTGTWAVEQVAETEARPQIEDVVISGGKRIK